VVIHSQSVFQAYSHLTVFARELIDGCESFSAMRDRAFSLFMYSIIVGWVTFCSGMPFISDVGVFIRVELHSSSTDGTDKNVSTRRSGGWVFAVMVFRSPMVEAEHKLAAIALER
jgi:hypothetical protein